MIDLHTHSTFSDGTYTPEQLIICAKELKKLSLKYVLKESGGSDFHGENKPDIMLGSGRGNLNIPNAVLKELFRRNKLVEHYEKFKSCVFGYGNFCCSNIGNKYFYRKFCK